MHLPTEISRALSAARALEEHRTAPHATSPHAEPRAVAPARARGAAAPAPGKARATQSLQAPSGTGINRWWRYQEENIAGGGHVMINVGTGNVLIQDDDMRCRTKA